MYLVGNRVKGTVPMLDRLDVGLMNTPKNNYALGDAWLWAADNGCFGKGYPGDAAWLSWLDSFAESARDRCLFATAPDVVGDARASLARSAPHLSAIRDYGYPVALVTQDGMTPEMAPWSQIDWVFIGGTDRHKLGSEAKRLIAAALLRGKRVHVGRVNSERRFLAFAALGCDTADGTFLGFGPRVNLPKLQSWIRHERLQLPLFERCT